MTATDWVIVTGFFGALAVLVMGAAIGATQRSRRPGQHRLPAQEHWDYIEQRWPSPGIGSMNLNDERDYRGGWASGACWDRPGYEERWPGDEDPDGPDMPDMLAAEPVVQGPGLADAGVASAADDPEDAGWTDQLLADLRDTPTSLDGPVFRTEPGPCYGPDCDHVSHQAEPSRLADTGDIELISQRADYAAELRAQDDDAALFRSRMTSDMAAFRLHGLA